MRIAIFAPEGDRVAAHIEARARERGLDVLRFSFASVAEGAPIAFDAEDWMIRGEVLNECDAFVVRQFPAIAAMLSDDPFEVLTAETWWQRALQQVERSHLAQSCIMHLELGGKPVVNPLMASGPYDFKPLQLAAFRRAGIPVPATLVTNATSAVRAFREQYPDLIFKPTSGGAETRVLDDATMERLDAIAGMPVIFQQHVRGADIRVTIVANRVVSAVEIPGDAVDYRSRESYRAGEQTYIEHPLSPEVEALCLSAARTCHHVLSGVDLKRTDGGEYVVLEANSAPVYVDIELKTGAPITAALLDHLTGQ